MSRLFRRPSSKAATQPDADPNSAYSSLLDPVSHLPQHRRTKSSPSGLRRQQQDPGRPWLLTAAAGSRTSGERPPARKLVKDPGGGSARPSFSLELSDSDAEKEKGIFGRGIDRLKELYRRSDRS